MQSMYLMSVMIRCQLLNALPGCGRPKYRVVTHDRYLPRRRARGACREIDIAVGYIRRERRRVRVDARQPGRAVDTRTDGITVESVGRAGNPSDLTNDAQAPAAGRGERAGREYLVAVKIDVHLLEAGSG